MQRLLSSLVRRKTLESPVREAEIPHGQRVYAIGDVHGRFDLLIGLLDRIRADNRKRGAADTQVVMLGDMIDRGAGSAHVIEYLRALRGSFATFHFIRGNHEEVMLAALAEGAVPEEIGWLEFGGYETMKSYGASDALFVEEGPALARAMRAMVPDTHLVFLQQLVDRVIIGDYLFVHAGICPGVPIDRQSGEDMRWIREPFLTDERDHGMIVVHGHSQCIEPQFRANRIGIDTGAYRTGRLTALGLEGADRWVVSERKSVR